ncbi:MAG: TIGR01212 family radical SAM protein [Planctomycetota bacterium]
MTDAQDWRFRPLRPWLESTFGRPLHRVALDAGSTCPNRDGSRGYGGCVYCDVEGSGTGALKSGTDIRSQLEQGIRRVARRDPADFGVVAYFQSYSNTYVEPERLDEVLAAIEPFLGDPVDAVALATRPDTLPDWAIRRLAELAKRVPVWLELGLEAADDALLERIHRLHTVAEFETAVERAHAAGLLVVGHAILGLPGDGREGARRTAEVLARTGCAGVKVHHLMVLRRTVLERWWKDGEVELLEPETYVDWLADFVERLAPSQVLHRLTGDAPWTEQLAPRWTVHKSAIRERLRDELARRGTRQGSARA